MLLHLLATQVLDTLVKPSHAYSIDDLVKLAMIVGIRTVLAYFLNLETTEAEHELESDEGNNVTI